MLSHSAEYALCAAVFLAANPRQPCTAAEIARTVRAPTGYLVKVLARLAKAKLVVAQRGRHGGFMLARAPASISMLDVITASSPTSRTPTCPSCGDAHLPCLLYLRLGQAMALEKRFYRTLSLSQLVGGLACRPPSLVARPKEADKKTI